MTGYEVSVKRVAYGKLELKLVCIIAFYIRKTLYFSSQRKFYYY